MGQSNRSATSLGVRVDPIVKEAVKNSAFEKGPSMAQEVEYVLRKEYGMLERGKAPI